MNIRRTAVSAMAIALALSLGACGAQGEAAPTAEQEPAAETTPEEDMSEDMGGDMGGEERAEDASTDTFGPGCELIPAEGAGSFNGMATEPVATAASANPLLKTLVTAVGEAGLVDDLNSAEALTVFAPTDDAFAKIPPADLEAVLADKELLTTVLTHHVVAGQLTPEQLAGEHETLAGDTVSVTGSGEEFMVGDERAAVLCGNIKTANATVYVVDTVLMP